MTLQVIFYSNLEDPQNIHDTHFFFFHFDLCPIVQLDSLHLISSLMNFSYFHIRADYFITLDITRQGILHFHHQQLVMYEISLQSLKFLLFGAYLRIIHCNNTQGLTLYHPHYFLYFRNIHTQTYFILMLQLMWLQDFLAIQRIFYTYFYIQGAILLLFLIYNQKLVYHFHLLPIHLLSY